MDRDGKGWKFTLPATDSSQLFSCCHHQLARVFLLPGQVCDKIYGFDSPKTAARSVEHAEDRSVFIPPPPPGKKLDVPLKRDHFKRKGLSSKHYFSGGALLDFGGVYDTSLSMSLLITDMSSDFQPLMTLHYIAWFMGIFTTLLIIITGLNG